MPDKKYNHLYGPVPSRRLGLSLGVDLVPFKTCCYDCVYCQIGRTTNKTIERREYVPVDDVIAELKQKCGQGLEANYITMAGSGEPTLNSGIGRVIDAAKEITDIRVAVITNGGTFSDPQVREEMLNADLVVPSLDCGTGGAFERVNRPEKSMRFDRMVDGLVAFRKMYRGRFRLEIFLVKDLNDDDDEILMMKDIAEEINPDKIELNTVVRPPSESFAQCVSDKRLREIAEMFGEKAVIIAPFTGSEETLPVKAAMDDVLEMLARRPCSLGDISSGLRIHRTEASKSVARLLAEGLIVEKELGDESYYVSVESSGNQTGG